MRKRWGLGLAGLVTGFLVGCASSPIDDLTMLDLSEYERLSLDSRAMGVDEARRVVDDAMGEPGWSHSPISMKMTLAKPANFCSVVGEGSAIQLLQQPYGPLERAYVHKKGGYMRLFFDDKRKCFNQIDIDIKVANPQRVANAFAVLAAAEKRGDIKRVTGPYDEAHWQRIEKSNDPLDFETFLKKWARSERVEQAIDRVMALRSAEAAVKRSLPPLTFRYPEVEVRKTTHAGHAVTFEVKEASRNQYATSELSMHKAGNEIVETRKEFSGKFGILVNEGRMNIKRMLGIKPMPSAVITTKVVNGDANSLFPLVLGGVATVWYTENEETDFTSFKNFVKRDVRKKCVVDDYDDAQRTYSIYCIQSFKSEEKTDNNKPTKSGGVEFVTETFHPKNAR